MASDLIYREDAKIFVRHACYKKINPIDYLDEVPAVDVVPLPKGHGRIVDAAEILEKAKNSPWFDGDVAELGLLLGSEVATIAPAEGCSEE